MAIVMMAMSPTKMWADDEVPTISDGSSFTMDISNEDWGSEYTFTPATTGYYSFTISQAVYATVYDDDYYYAPYQICKTLKSYAKLVAGHTYYLNLYSTGDAITGATVTVAACDAPTTTSTMTGTTTTETVPAYGVTYVKYVPTANHRYSVSVTGANDASEVVLEKKGTDDYIEAFATWVDNGWVYLFENGKEYALGLCNSVAEEKELTLTLNEDNTTPFINGTSYTISTLESYGSVYLRLTPTETKEYTLSVNKDNVRVQIHTENGWIYTQNGATSVSAALTAGTTYYIKIDNIASYAINDITLTVSGEGGETPTNTALTVNDNTAHIYAYDGACTDPKYYFTFTPTEPGEYTFSFSSGGSPINVFANIGKDTDLLGSVQNGPYFTSSALTAETTYNLYVDGGEDEYESATITITKVNGSSSSYQTVQEGKANVNEITIPAGQGSELVQFTAPATFRFQFKTSVSDYLVSLFSGVPGEEGTIRLASVKGECQYDCTGGQTYYIVLSKRLSSGQSMSADEQIGLSILRVHQREMSYEWGTVCLPFSINYDPNNGNYKLYMPKEATSSELKFLEYPAGNISQGSPMAVKAVGSKNAETQKYTINIVAGNKPIGISPSKAEVVGDYTFKGTLTEMTNQTGIYFIAQNKFWWAEDAITVPAYRAYLEGPAPSNGAKAFSIVVEGEDETTSIHNAEFIMQNEMRNGKYLENGKIVIMKNGQKYNLNGQALK